MRTTLSLIVFLTLLLWVPSGDQGRVHARGAHSPEIVLHLLPPMVSATSIKLPYKIPYPGYIEFYLFDTEKKKIWQDFGVKEKGEHAQSLKAEKFEKGKTYFYEFWYKGKPYSGKFAV